MFLTYLKYRLGHRSIEKLSHEMQTLRNATYWRTKQFDAELFLRFVAEKGIRKFDFKGLVRSVMEYDASRKDKAVAGAKFPAHVFYYPAFKHLWGFKRARFVFLARAPEDIAFSQFNKHEIKNSIVRLAMILHVAWMFNLTVFYGRLVAKNSAHLIRYEDFKNDKEMVLRELCRFIGQEYDDAMLEVKVFDSQIRENTKAYHLSRMERLVLRLFTFPWAAIYNKH